MRSKLIISIIIFLSTCFSECFAMETLFYVLRNDAIDRVSAEERAVASLSAHHQAINLLVSQAYNIDENGVLWGHIDPEVLAIAKQNNMKLLPLITNTEFNKEVAHQFLSNEKAQAEALKALLDVATREHFYGVQFDFEMVALEDRDALTQFYTKAAKALHQKGLIMSIAVAPLVSESPQASVFLKRIYVNWEGAYDLKKLGEIADFVSVMAYNQHGGTTTPGPTATIAWVETAIQTALKYIPANKISLGIPAYSTYWYTSTEGDKPTGKLQIAQAGIDYAKAQFLLRRNHAEMKWDDKAQLNYAIYEKNWLYEYLYFEDEKSFAAKVALANKYHLRGISVFDLGTEDPRIWNVLQKN